MQVEWEVTLKCNYRCVYCTNLDQTLNVVEDKDTLRAFVKSLGDNYPGVEVFVFGGEPFLHPHIGFIVDCFNEFNIPFVIQTNFSKKSVKVMSKINTPFTIQISIHPTEVKLETLVQLFKTKANIRIIDVMYSSKVAMEYYFKIKELAPDTQTFLTPVTDFGDGVSNLVLLEYNKLKRNPTYQKFIQFERIERLGKDRSDLWIDPEFSPKGKPCLYNGKYFLYGPNLELYNCCYRKQHNGICQHDKCFLM
jgi:hypothetical protein